MICSNHNAFPDEPRIKTRPENSPIHDKSVRNASLAPPRLRKLRHRVQLQPVRAVLVRGRGLSDADANGRQRLPVPGLPAQGGRERGGDVTGPDMTSRWDVHAVLLDMDGTLLDTERVYFDSLVTALGAFLTVTWFEKLLLSGINCSCGLNLLGVSRQINRHCERSEAIHTWLRRPMDCFASRFARNDVDRDTRYRTTAAVCPNNTRRSSSVRFTGWPKFGLISFASA